ncbi:HNH endonuclease family protein [Pedococcus aerophilus]|uniref:HNH endonuclease family protein n=1 Tax=Pedococcus aerophilus TaxID=436356 RepID=A0ABP6H893_9MICO
MTSPSSLVRAAAASVLALAALPVAASAASALPPPAPSVADSRDQLATLTVRAENNTGYDRTLFTHWITITPNCDTRETVLKRDGVITSTDSACKSTGTWTSVYDGVKTTDPSTFDIDHVIPLAEAWGSGASSWTSTQRKDFANDLVRPQLIAVSASSNRSKSDQDPAEWQPPSTAWRCEYVREWINVKYYWDLDVDSAEKAAVEGMLDTDC